MLAAFLAPPRAEPAGVHSIPKNGNHDRMSTEASRRRSPMISLRELIDRYIAVAAGFGIPVALSSFALGQTETERLFSGYEEDYHISRFLHFSQNAGLAFSINGFPATHVSIDAEVQSIL